MEDERDKPETTSRRDFAKAVVTAAVAVPIAASLGGDNTVVGQSKARAKRPTVTGTTPATIELAACPEQVARSKGDHIPPMGIDGGGELRIESHNLFATTDARSPYTYTETAADRNRYGHLVEVVVIGEPIKGPRYRMSVTRYCDLEPKSELRLWYQPIDGDAKPDPKDPDHLYAPREYDLDLPDAVIVGGYGGNYAKITVRNNPLADWVDSHREATKYLRRHAPDNTQNSPMRRLFRIGYWEIVGPKDVRAFGEGGQSTSIYLIFDKYA